MHKDEQLAITKYDLLFEQRMTRVESAIERIDRSLFEIKNENKEIKNENKEVRMEIRSDFRWLLALMIGFGITLTGVMAKGFGWI